MSNIRNIETNPTKAIPIDKEQTINRLEKIKEKCDKFSNIMVEAFKGSMFVGGVVAASGIVFSSIILSTPVIPVLGTTALTSCAVFVASGASLVANKFVSTVVESKLKNLQRQVNSKSYFQKILDKERKKLKVSEEAANGTINIKTLRDAGIDIGSISSIERFTKESSRELSERKKTVVILETAQKFMEKCDNKESVLKILDLAENPMENKDAIQKIVLPRQTPAETSMNDVAKSVTQRDGERS